MSADTLTDAQAEALRLLLEPNNGAAPGGRTRRRFDGHVFVHTGTARALRARGYAALGQRRLGGLIATRAGREALARHEAMQVLAADRARLAEPIDGATVTRPEGDNR